MVREKLAKGDSGKAKPRGRPFTKGTIPHNKRKSDSTLLDDSGHEKRVEGGVIALDLQSSIVEPTNKPETQEIYMSPEQVANFNPRKEMEDLPPNEDQEKEPALTLLETIDFMKGNNKISLRLSRRHNRLYRLQIFLNDTMEIRPVTYNGASTAYSYWNVLKEIMK